MNVLVIGYYTTGAYEKEAERLRASCEKFSISHALQEFERFDSWNEAVAFKPQFVLACIDAFREVDGFLYVDADAAFMQEPDYEIFRDRHISWHRFVRRPRTPPEFLTGTMYFANTPSVRAFVEEWASNTQRYIYHDTPEQQSLIETWTRAWQEKLWFLDMPPGWVYIYDTFGKYYGDIEITVKHYQASRRLKQRKKRKRT